MSGGLPRLAGDRAAAPGERPADPSGVAWGRAPVTCAHAERSRGDSAKPAIAAAGVDGGRTPAGKHAGSGFLAGVVARFRPARASTCSSRCP